MSTHSPEQRKQDTLPPFPTDETVVVPPPEHRDDKHEARQGFSLRAKLGAFAAIVATGIGGVVGYNVLSGGDKDPQDKRAEQSTSQSVEPGELVAFSDENNDRNGDGSFDNFTDVNDNGITDSDELYDTATGEFVDPAAGTDEAALEGASEEELTMIASIESAFPTINEVEPHWKATFLDLDTLVQKFAVEQASRSGDFETTDDWQAAVLLAATGGVSAEEIKEAAANAE